MSRLQFRDVWTKAGKCEPSHTNSMSTHTDYVYTNIQADQVMEISTVLHHPSDASDHRMVIATFKLKHNC